MGGWVGVILRQAVCILPIAICICLLQQFIVYIVHGYFSVFSYLLLFAGLERRGHANCDYNFILSFENSKVINYAMICFDQASLCPSDEISSLPFPLHQSLVNKIKPI